MSELKSLRRLPSESPRVRVGGEGGIAHADPAVLRRKAEDCQVLAEGTCQKELRRILEHFGPGLG